MVKFELDEYHRNIPDGVLLDDLGRISAIANKGRVIQDGYKLLGGRYCWQTIANRFGSWNKALALAGLELNNRTDISDEELLEDLQHVATKLSSNSITGDEYLLNGGRFDRRNLIRRFQTWNKALRVQALS